VSRTVTFEPGRDEARPFDALGDVAHPAAITHIRDAHHGSHLIATLQLE
jgi:hypothetical protein